MRNEWTGKNLGMWEKEHPVTVQFSNIEIFNLTYENINNPNLNFETQEKETPRKYIIFFLLMISFFFNNFFLWYEGRWMWIVESIIISSPSYLHMSCECAVLCLTCGRTIADKYHILSTERIKHPTLSFNELLTQCFPNQTFHQCCKSVLLTIPQNYSKKHYYQSGYRVQV
jgi:DNA-directed RNA polymerase subunit N (RpoN/RPB10)